jgi:hypothetical protein
MASAFGHLLLYYSAKFYEENSVLLAMAHVDSFVNYWIRMIEYNERMQHGFQLPSTAALVL